MDENRKTALVYSKNNITFYCSDCFDLLSSVPSGSVKLIISSPPYCTGRTYEKSTDNLQTFIQNHQKLMPELIRILAPGGSLCWEIGFRIENNEVTPLDYIVNNVVQSWNNSRPANEIKMKLRGRLIWTFGHGLTPKKRFAGRYETILWYTKGDDYSFSPDSIRIPQKYPGKKYSLASGDRAGQYSCNPLGKVPSDVWDIPNVKKNHVEKTEHPCQFPEAIPARFIKCLTQKGDLVFDPFLGSGTTAVAAYLNGRRFLGCEKNPYYFGICQKRIESAFDGTIRIRPDVPVITPDKKQKVAQNPFLVQKGGVLK